MWLRNSWTQFFLNRKSGVRLVRHSVEGRKAYSDLDSGRNRAYALNNFSQEPRAILETAPVLHQFAQRIARRHLPAGPAKLLNHEVVVKRKPPKSHTNYAKQDKKSSRSDLQRLPVQLRMVGGNRIVRTKEVPRLVAFQTNEGMLKILCLEVEEHLRLIYSSAPKCG